MPNKDFRVYLFGSWSRSKMQIQYQANEYVLPDLFVRQAITFWETLLATGSRRVFNGALCRLEEFSEKNGMLCLSLSRTCYRDLLFSNDHVDELVRELGENGPVRALGISALIETVDGFMPLIRRSEHVGEAPGGLDVIGGHIHPDEHGREGIPDIFFAMANEIHAEIGVPRNLLDDMICCGLAENCRHRKPELVFYIVMPMTMKEIEQQIHHAHEADEFTELIAVRVEKASLQRFIEENAASITPSAHACFQLVGMIKSWW
jgi:hypothetical protein